MRGKTKIVSSTFLLSIMLVSFVAVFGVPTVYAPTTLPILKTTQIVNPLLNPGDTFGVSILLNNTVNLWSLEFTLDFDTSLITPIGYFFASGAPTSFTNVFVADLNDAGGYVHLGATRPPFGGKIADFLGEGDGVTKNYTLAKGVLQAGSEQAFYGVFNETLGMASFNRDPGPWTGGGGDGKVNRMPIIPSPYPGIEKVWTYGLPQYGDPRIYGYPWQNSVSGDPADPYWQVDYATGYVVTKPWLSSSRRIRLGETVNIDYATLDGVPTVNATNYALSGGVGSVLFNAAPAVGEKVYLQYNYRQGLTTGPLIQLAASIIFKVDARGVCPLHFSSSTMLDQYIPANTIAHTAIDGVFDNRLQGTMSVPHIVDTTLIEPGAYFDVYVSVGPWMGKPVDKLWGFQFIMSFDPNVVMAVNWEVVARNNATSPVWTPGPSEIGVDYAAISGDSYYGDPIGLSTNVPVEVARIGFVVVGTGVTLLTLHDTRMANVDGATMVHEVDSGSFANTENISVSLNAIFVESRKWSVSKDGSAFTLTSQVTNTGMGITMVRSHFKVYDSLGVVVADLTTTETDIFPLEVLRQATALSVGPLAKPASYVVEGTVEYVNYLGSWVTGHKGSPSGSRSTMVKTFTLYP